MSKYCCKSVLGGWQTLAEETQTLIGPVFNSCNDLWDWQRDHLPKATRPLYVVLASAIAARLNCIESNNTEWLDRWTDRVESLVKEHMPSGGGFDSGTELVLRNSTAEKLVFSTSFHHMDSVGYYDGWTDHTVTVKPSFIHGVYMSISGRNKRDIKEYLAERFHTALFTPVSTEL